jgi:hypothetical protein
VKKVHLPDSAFADRNKTLPLQNSCFELGQGETASSTFFDDVFPANKKTICMTVGCCQEENIRFLDYVLVLALLFYPDYAKQEVVKKK